MAKIKQSAAALLTFKMMLVLLSANSAINLQSSSILSMMKPSNGRAMAWSTPIISLTVLTGIGPSRRSARISPMSCMPRTNKGSIPPLARCASGAPPTPMGCTLATGFRAKDSPSGRSRPVRQIADHPATRLSVWRYARLPGWHHPEPRSATNTVGFEIVMVDGKNSGVRLAFREVLLTSRGARTAAEQDVLPPGQNAPYSRAGAQSAWRVAPSSTPLIGNPCRV